MLELNDVIRLDWEYFISFFLNLEVLEETEKVTTETCENDNYSIKWAIR